MNQIGNLTFYHKSLESSGQMKSNWGVLDTVEKIFLRATSYFTCIFKKKFDLKKI